MSFQNDDLFLVNRGGDSFKTEYVQLKQSINEENGVHVDDSPPADPNDGDLWFNSDDGRLYVWYVTETTGIVTSVSTRNGGSGYTVDANDVETIGGSGTGLTVNIQAGVGGNFANPTVNSGGHSYKVGDVVFVTGAGHGNGSISVTAVNSAPVGQWVDASPDSPSANLWEKSGTTLSPANAGDSVDIGSGNIELNADGSATFAGNVQIDHPNIVRSGTTSSTNDDIGAFIGGPYGSVTSYPDVYDSSTVAWGTATQAIQVISRDTLPASGESARKVKFAVRNDGSLRMGTDLTSSTDATGNIVLKANDGSAIFRGVVTLDRSQPMIRFNRPGHIWDILDSSSGIGFWGLYDRTNSRYAIRYYTDGTSNYSGISSFDGIKINTDIDNPANYTTTTDEEGNETQVYDGPTLDVKDRILNLISRLDAIEANEQIDDATDTSLLQLVASASARLDSIEARLTALEGGN